MRANRLMIAAAAFSHLDAVFGENVNVSATGQDAGGFVHRAPNAGRYGC
jgi:hypothetical protein